jgi:hypothetical protein
MSQFRGNSKEVAMSNSDRWLKMVDDVITKMDAQSVSDEEVPQLCANLFAALQALSGSKEPLLAGRVRELAKKTETHIFRLILEAVANDIARQSVTA